MLVREPGASVFKGMGSACCSLFYQAAVGFCIVALCAQLCASQSEPVARQRRSRLHPFASQSSPQSDRGSHPHTLRFELCNGFANQRIALATGVALARLLDRTAVLPEAVLNGSQGTDDWRYDQSDNHTPLSDIYDTEVSNFRRCGSYTQESSPGLESPLFSTPTPLPAEFNPGPP